MLAHTEASWQWKCCFQIGRLKVIDINFNFLWILRIKKKCWCLFFSTFRLQNPRILCNISFKRIYGIFYFPCHPSSLLPLGLVVFIWVYCQYIDLNFMMGSNAKCALKILTYPPVFTYILYKCRKEFKWGLELRWNRRKVAINQYTFIALSET